MPPSNSSSSYNPLNDYMKYAASGQLHSGLHRGLLFMISKGLPNDRKTEIMPYYNQLGAKNDLPLSPATQQEIAHRYKYMVPQANYGTQQANANNAAKGAQTTTMENSRKRKQEVVEILSDSSSDEKEAKPIANSAPRPGSWEDYVRRKVEKGEDPKSFIPQRGETSNTYFYNNMSVTVISTGDPVQPPNKKVRTEKLSGDRGEVSQSFVQRTQNVPSSNISAFGRCNG